MEIGAGVLSESSLTPGCQDTSICVTCPFCISKANRKFSFSSYFGWISHLMSKKNHQKASRILLENWSDEWNTGSLVIENYFPKDKTTTKSNIKCLLRCFGNVNNCILTRSNNAIVMFKSLELREKAISKDMEVLAESFDMRLRRCEEINKNDWKSLVNDVELIVQNDELTAERSKERDLKEQMELLKQATSLSNEDLAVRMKIVEILRANLVLKFPKCRLYPYGSFVTRLGDKRSDIDIFVDVEGIAEAGHSYPKDCKWLKMVSEIVKNIRDPEDGSGICHSIAAITTSRVPFVRAVFVCNNFVVNCDLTFTNILGFMNTELICLYMDMDPRVRLLLHLVRYWGQFHSVTSSTTLKNYALALMVLVFLARKKIVPTICELQKLCNEPILVDGLWNCNFCRDMEEIRRLLPADASAIQQNGIEVATLQLAQEFFQEMAKFNFEEYSICTLTADYMPRSYFSQDQYLKLPEPLEPFITWMLIQPKMENWIKTSKCPFKLNAKLIIQDPFDLSSNVGISAKRNIVQRFVTCCAMTSEALESMLLLHFSQQSDINLMDIFQNRSGLNLLNPFEYITKTNQEIPAVIAIEKIEKKAVGTGSVFAAFNSTKLEKSNEMFGLISKSICGPPDDKKFETGITFHVSDAYLQMVNEAFKNKPVHANYVDLTNRLWICFALEFLDNVWKCFTVDIIDHKLIVHGNSAEKIQKACHEDQSNTFLQFLNSNELCRASNSSRDCVSILALLKKSSWLVEKDVVTVVHCQLHRNVWAQRATFDAYVIKDDGKNPLGYEWEITQKLLKAQDQGNPVPGKARFTVGVKIAYDSLQCEFYPAVHLVFKMETSKAHSHAFSHMILKTMFPKLLSQYTTFRLSQIIND